MKSQILKTILHMILKVFSMLLHKVAAMSHFNVFFTNQLTPDSSEIFFW